MVRTSVCSSTNWRDAGTVQTDADNYTDVPTWREVKHTESVEGNTANPITGRIRTRTEMENQYEVMIGF